MTPHRVGVFVLGTGLLAACAAGEIAEVPVVVRDSAGIQIVENPGDDAVVPVWQLEAPKVSIGVLEGEPAYQLDGVRDAMLHGDRIIVVNGGSRELRFYDLQGQHIRTAGRKGGGPGEFEGPSWMAPHRGDSIIIYDIQQRRLSVFDGDGNFGRSITPEFSFGTMVGRFADGTYVVRPGIFISTSMDIKTGRQRSDIGIVRVSEEGKVLDTLGIYPGSEAIVDAGGTGDRRFVSIRTIPFGLSTQVAAGDSVVYVGTSDAWRIDVLDTAGTLRRSIRRAAEAPALTPEMIDRFREERLGAITDENIRRESERFYTTVDYPERMPAYAALRLDEDGNLWVQDYVVSREDSLRWRVFDPAGRILGRVAMPPRMMVFRIGPDFVLGRVQDDLDVEHVVLFGLARSRSREIADAAAR